MFAITWVVGTAISSVAIFNPRYFFSAAEFLHQTLRVQKVLLDFFLLLLLDFFE